MMEGRKTTHLVDKAETTDNPTIQEVNSTETPVPEKSDQTYLMMVGIYDATVGISAGKQMEVFLLHFSDLEGKQYICPVYADQNNKEGVKKSLRRIKPVPLQIDGMKEEFKQEG